jgi:hypothetical protein
MLGELQLQDGEMRVQLERQAIQEFAQGVQVNVLFDAFQLGVVEREDLVVPRPLIGRQHEALPADLKATFHFHEL